MGQKAQSAIRCIKTAINGKETTIEELRVRKHRAP